VRVDSSDETRDNTKFGRGAISAPCKRNWIDGPKISSHCIQSTRHQLQVKIVSQSSSASMSSLIINNAPQSPGLLDQPNEVLQMIVRIVSLNNTFVKFVDQNGERRQLCQYLVLAQVCRRLRTVVLEADFWQDPDFDFSSLLPARQESSVVQGIREGGLVRALLDNVEFLRSLKRKKQWIFGKTETLLTVVMSGKWFYQNAEAIGLRQQTDLDAALEALSLCRQVKILDLRPTWDQFDLSLIARSFPNLEELHLFCAELCEGSIDQLNAIRSLTIEGYEIDWDVLTPLRSVSTLTSLNCQGTESLPAFLDKFSNLTHLRFAPPTAEMVEQLRHLLKIKLRSLAIDFSATEEIEYVIPLWAAECLMDLKQLRLRFLCYDTDGVLIQTMSRCVINPGLPNWTTLENLTLEGGFDVAWGPLLASLKNLKCLQLKIHDGGLGCTIRGQFFTEGTFLDFEALRPCFDAWRDPKELTTILKNEFFTPPTIKVSFHETRDCFDNMDEELVLRELGFLCGDYI